MINAAIEKSLFSFLDDEYYRLMIDMAKESKDSPKSISERYKKLDNQKLFEICKEHDLVGVAGYYAKKLSLELCEAWEQEYEKQKNRLQFLKEKSAEICKIMDDNGIKMVILKNGGIMHDIMTDSPVLNPMEDIDSLVKKGDFYRAHDLLTRTGFTFKFRSEFEKEILDEAFRDGSTEYYINTPDGETMWFELAWRSVSGRWIRPDLEPDTDEFIERSHCTKGTHVHVLSPEDNLLQVCIHTAKHSYCRAPGLRLNMDVDRIVTHTNIDWERFLQAVRKTHVKKSVFLSLYIPHKLFGTRIPDYVLNQLEPKDINALLTKLAKAELIHPHQRKFSKAEFLFFQTSLYDSKKDMISALYPGKEWMKERYDCKNGFSIALFTFWRLLDLCGIRKKK